MNATKMIAEIFDASTTYSTEYSSEIAEMKNKVQETINKSIVMYNDTKDSRIVSCLKDNVQRVRDAIAQQDDERRFLENAFKELSSLNDRCDRLEKDHERFMQEHDQFIRKYDEEQAEHERFIREQKEKQAQYDQFLSANEKFSSHIDQFIREYDEKQARMRKTIEESNRLYESLEFLKFIDF